ncbi:hypothetical protein [Alphaproteobacteria bacterium endosymbiont of Tiliacea citrago]
MYFGENIRFQLQNNLADAFQKHNSKYFDYTYDIFSFKAEIIEDIK